MNPCAHCEEIFVEGDTGVFIPTIPEGAYPFHWNCHLRGIFSSVAHIEERCSCFVPGATCGDPWQMTARQAADASVAAYRALHERYPIQDHNGMLWRMEGGRPISRLADKCMESEKERE